MISKAGRVIINENNHSSNANKCSYNTHYIRERHLHPHFRSHKLSAVSLQFSSGLLKQKKAMLVPRYQAGNVRVMPFVPFLSLALGVFTKSLTLTERMKSLSRNNGRSFGWSR